MLSTMRTPKAKRACEDCHRRKRRCTHVVTENQQNPSDQLDDLSNHLDSLTTNKDNIAAMDREYDYDYNMNKSSATKRVRKGAQSQEPLPSAAGPSSAAPSSSSISKGPQGQQPFTFAAGPSSAGPSSSSISKGAQSQEPLTSAAGSSSRRRSRLFFCPKRGPGPGCLCWHPNHSPVSRGSGQHVRC